MKNKYIKLSHISERKFQLLLKQFALDIPAEAASDIISLNRNTVNRIYGQLRLRLVSLSAQEAEAFTGEIEVDESYFGARRVRGKRGRGAKGKIPVIGLLKRQGKVYTQIIPNCERKQLLPVIKGRILKNSTVYTDGWSSYDSLVLNGYKHHRIYHSENEFARGKNHVNGIESFWGFTKTRMVKLRGVRKDKFLIHLKESEWRFNNRHDNIYKVLLKELRRNPL